MARTTLYVLGALFLVSGVWAYFTTPVAGLFPMNAVHAALHLCTGLIMLLVALFAPLQSSLATRIFGILYAVLAIGGFVMGSGLLFGVIDVNLFDNILHVIIALMLLWAGFAVKTSGDDISLPSEPMGTGM